MRDAWASWLWSPANGSRPCPRGLPPLGFRVYVYVWADARNRMCVVVKRGRLYVSDNRDRIVQRFSIHAIRPRIPLEVHEWSVSQTDFGFMRNSHRDALFLSKSRGSEIRFISVARSAGKLRNSRDFISHRRARIHCIRNSFSLIDYLFPNIISDGVKSVR